jgi:hypothetical protein
VEESPLTSTPQRHPALGLLAEIAGIIGALVCIVAIVGVLLGRSWVGERVTTVADGVVGALDRAVAVGAAAEEGLAEWSAQAGELRTAAEELAENPALDERAVAAVQERLAPLAERYQTARDSYVRLRERATDLFDLVRRLDQLAPGIELPGTLEGLVTGMDDRLVALDTAISDLSSRAVARTTASDAATAIATGAATLESHIADAATVTSDVQAGLADLQDDVDQLAGRVHSIIGISSITVAAIFAWVAVLHLALWALGRHWRRG